MHGERVYEVNRTRLGLPGDPQRLHMSQVLDRHSLTGTRRGLVPCKIQLPQSRNSPQVHRDETVCPSNASRSELVQEKMRENKDLQIWTPERGPRTLRHSG